MKSVRKKMLVSITILGVIPMLLYSFFYYDLQKNRTMDALNAESVSILEQLDNRMVMSTSRIQNSVDIVFDDASLYEILRNTDFTGSEKNLGEAKAQLDEMLGKLLRTERSLESIVLFSANGGAYVLGNGLEEKDPVRFMINYGHSGTDAGVLTWLGLKKRSDDTDSNVIVSSIMLRDVGYVKDHKYLATIYLIFSGDLFDGTQTEEVYTESENISVYDNGGKMIYSRGDGRVSDIFRDASIAEGRQIYKSSEGSFTIKSDNRDYVAVYYTSHMTGWKLVRTIPADRYENEFKYITYMAFAALLVMVLVWYIVSYFIVKKITLPIYEVAGAMKEVGEENLNVRLRVHSKDEFGVISTGFNSMVKHIGNLIEKVRAEEQKCKELDILMLQYQMNPHFLYNTLGAIRVTAIINKQGEISEMLLILGRFLKNTISNAGKSVKVNDEIANINDYISLYQIRYENQLKVSISVDEACRECKMPGMLLQPIVENAIMHGLNDKFDSLEAAEIEINVCADGDNMCISVYDNGCGISQEKISQIFNGGGEGDNALNDRLHIGMQNICRRINLLYGAEYGMEIESEVGEYTVVKLTIPLSEE